MRWILAAIVLAGSAHAMPESVDGLSASGPRAELRQQLALYAPFIGSWDVVSILHRPDGRTERREGEWNWGWILEGRGIQDVFIIPARGKRLVVIVGSPRALKKAVATADTESRYTLLRERLRALAAK